MTKCPTSESRSALMKCVRRERTTEERLLEAALIDRGLLPELNVSSLPGKPDLVFYDAKLAVFVDGDFWHGRQWFEEGRAPVNNREFWVKRFEDNKRRDRRVGQQLRRQGWSVSRVWGSAVRSDPKKVAVKINRRLRRLRKERAS